jgi:ParB/RepB/Spo0J family partition protein
MKLKRSEDWQIYDIPLQCLTSNRSNPRDSSPILIRMGYGIFEPLGNKPSLLSMALSDSPAMRLAFVDLIEKYEPSIAAMGNDIRDKELFHNIAVCPVGDNVYDVVFGCRRVLAFAYLSCKHNIQNQTIPARIKNWEMKDRYFISFAENHYRLGQTAIDEARYYKKMAEENINVSEIAARCGCNEQHVRNRLKLNQLPTEIQDKVASGKIGITKATKMAGLTEEELLQKQEEMEKKKNRQRAPTIRDLREWYEKDNSLTEDVRKFIALRLLRVKYQPRKHALS